MQTNMADSQESGLAAEESGNLAVNGTAVVVSTPCIAEGESETVGEDILQQAFVEAEEFDQEAVAFTVHADTDDVATSVAQEIDNSEIQDSGLDSTSQIVSSEDGFGTTTYTVVGALQDGTISLPDDLISHATVSETGEQHEGVEVTGDSVIDSNGHLVTSVHLDHYEQQLQETEPDVVQQVDGEAEGVAEELEEGQQEPQTVRFALVSGNSSSGAPLGSSQNPIRIIQQGNQYIPVQQLTTEQLQQIMQVVQQQQLARNTQESGGSILFNPATNTRIVYRVIYPAELHKGQQIVHVTPQSTTTTTIQSPAIQGQQCQTPKRQYRKKGKEDEEDKYDGPEMSKEEKEERKKHRPRTRSGRVSKPPKHMVKDYKHIHVLDWDEDYDDSDGGYSDYKGSDEEGKAARGRASPGGSDAQLFTGLGSTRPKNFKCQTCEKSYIGSAGLGRHYRLNPSHGSLPEGTLVDRDDAGEDSNSKSDSGMMMNMSSSVLMTSTPGAGMGSVGSSAGNLSEDSNTQDSIPSSTGAMSPVSATYTPRSHRGRGRSRGRWAYRHHTAPMKRKQKLRDLIKTCEDEDLMEVVLPRLAKVITLWEFMLMKIESSGASHPRMDHIYQQFAVLHKQVKRVCQESLQPIGAKAGIENSTQHVNGLEGEESRDSVVTTLKLDDAGIAQSLGFEAGTYEVKDIPMNDYSSFRYKFLTSDPNGPATPAEKRTIQLVTPDELVAQSPSKRQRVTSLLNPAVLASNSGMTPASAAASSLLTSIVTNSGLKRGVNRQPSAHNAMRTVSIQQPQTSVLRTVSVQQPQSKVLRTIAVQQPQNSTSRTFVVGASTPSRQQRGGQAGVMGISLLSPPGPTTNNSQQNSQQQVTVLRTHSLSSPHVLRVSTGPAVGSSPVEISLSQAATSSSLSFLQQSSSVNSDISAVAPMDFMDTSGDSIVSSVSGLSSTNTSGVVVMELNSMPNGEVTESGSVVRMNGVSEPIRLEPEELTGKVVSSSHSDSVLVSSVASMQENSLPVTSLPSAITSSGTTSFIVKCENGEVYQVTNSEAGQSSVGSGQVLGTALASCITASTKTTGAVSIKGQMNGTDALETVTVSKHQHGNATQSVAHDSSSANSAMDTVVSPDQLLADGGDEQLVVGESEQGEGQTLEEQHASIFQTEDGTLIIQNPDGTTFQLQGAQGIPLETVQALLAMEGHFEPGDQIQTEIQQ